MLTEDGKIIFEDRYAIDSESWEEGCQRQGHGAAKAEIPEKQAQYAEEYGEIICNLDFLPGGRIFRGLGRPMTNLLNCFVLDVEDSMRGIRNALGDMWEISAEGGGVGINFSKIRPAGEELNRKGGVASGPVSFMHVFDRAAAVICSGGARRAALKADLAVSHPSILEFIGAKLDNNELTNFNISSGITKQYLEAVRKKRKWELRFGGRTHEKLWAKDLWIKLMEYAARCGEPGLIHLDNIAVNNSWYYAPIISTNPCGELPLENYGSCCLGHINLSHFVTPGGRTKWQEMEKIIRLAVRFLDSIIDVNNYFLPHCREAAFKGRRIGLGVLGLADYFFQKEIQYGSDKCIEELDNLFSFIRNISYLASIDLAKEKGAFNAFDRDAYCSAKFIRRLPRHIQRKIYESGIRNVTLNTVAPTGCLTKDTFILTNEGLEKLEDIRSPLWRNGSQKSKWSDITRLVATGGPIQRATKFYSNGWSHIKEITLENGLRIRGTPKHRIKVKGDFWKPLGKLKAGDLVKVEKGQWFSVEEFALEEHGTYPQSIVPALAELIGLIWADGSIKNDRVIRITIADNEIDLKDWISGCLQILFGLELYRNVERRPGNKSFTILIHSKDLVNWLFKNDLLKGKAKELSIPKPIRCSSKDALCGFLRGLFTGDGSVEKTGAISFSSISGKLVEEVQVALLALGINSSRRIDRDRKSAKGSSPLHRLNIRNRDVFRKYIGFLSERKKEKVNSFNYRETKSQETLLLKVKNATTSHANTYDISVPCGNMYLANNIISHNTVSLLAGTTSGCEPLFSKAFKRTDRIRGKGGEENGRAYIHPMYKDLLSQGEGALKKVPKYYVDAFDITPFEHLEVQATIQKYVDGAISKTINCPSGTTAEKLSGYLLRYIDDLKGVTIYVDGSREEQVLHRLTEQEARQALPTAGDQPAVGECVTGVCDI